jgi:hypothetical protein
VETRAEAGEINTAMILKLVDQLKAQADEAARAVSAAVVPLFRLVTTAAPEADPDFEGSGVLLRIADRFFVLSAAHVFKALSSGVGMLTESGAITLTGAPRTGGLTGTSHGSDKDKIDIGFVELSDSEVVAIGRDNFLKSYNLAPRDADAALKTWYMLLGYPSKLQSVDLGDTVYHMQQLHYSGPEAQERRYAQCKLDRQFSVLIRCHKNRASGAAGKGGMVPLVGVSGGGVFRLRMLENYRADNRPLLVALTIERPACYGKAVLATRIELVLDGLRRAFPDVADSVPPSPLVSIKYMS